MSFGVGLDPNWPQVDKVGDLSHQRYNLVQVQHMLTHGLEESLFHTCNHFDIDLCSPIMVLGVRYDEQPFLALLCFNHH